MYTILCFLSLLYEIWRWDSSSSLWTALSSSILPWNEDSQQYRKAHLLSRSVTLTSHPSMNSRRRLEFIASKVQSSRVWKESCFWLYWIIRLIEVSAALRGEARIKSDKTYRLKSYDRVRQYTKLYMVSYAHSYLCTSKLHIRGLFQK
jgi:hypothetical protein